MAITYNNINQVLYNTSPDFKTIKYNKYYYYIALALINMDDNTVERLDDNLLAMKISFDYKNHVFPIMVIKISVSTIIYRTIRDHNVEVRLDIIKKIVNDDQVVSLDSSFNDEVYINSEMFTIIDKNKVIFNDDDLNENIPSLELTFTLFMNKHLSINKFLYNGNYLNTRLVDLLSKIPTTNNINNFLIENPSNHEVFEQLIVPPINSCRLPRFLQDKYSVYDSDIRVSFNYNDYIICNSRLSNNTPLLNNDYLDVIFDLYKINETETPYECGYKTSNGRYYYIRTCQNNVKISDKTHIKQEILGSRNIVFSKDETLSLDRIEWNEDSENMIVDKRQLYYDNYNSPYPLNNDSISEPLKAVFMFTNLDIDSFKANKLFHFNLNNKDYTMKISQVSFIFKKDTVSNLFLTNGVCLLENN